MKVSNFLSIFDFFQKTKKTLALGGLVGYNKSVAREYKNERMNEMNRSEIFKHAHQMAKNPLQVLANKSYRERLSFGLRRAYAIAKAEIVKASNAAKAVAVKSNQVVTVAEWIVKKNLSGSQSMVVIDYCDCQGTVERETEKAVFVRFYSKFGVIKSWFPKSTLVK